MARYVTPPGNPGDAASSDSTPPFLEWEEQDGRRDPRQRFAIYRLCECSACEGRGRLDARAPEVGGVALVRCPTCRGEGRVRELVATSDSPESLGVALVTLGREGEWEDCPIGILDRMGEKGQKWIVRPWLPSSRNVSDAAKLLRSKRS